MLTLIKQYDIILLLLRKSTYRWAHSSAGRASALQAGGHRFDPYCAHHLYGPVVQLVRTLACHARGRGFESLPGRHFFLITARLFIFFTFFKAFASVAQSVEQGTENPRVGGSIPPGGTICGSGSVVERHLAKVNVASSNLVFRSKKYNERRCNASFVVKMAL